jgi:Na+/melibiose symporter-like transporter
MYFLTYVVGHVEWAALYFIVGKIGLLLGVLISSQLTRRFCKRSVVIWTTLASVAVLLLLHVMDLSNRWQLYAWIFTVSALGAIKVPVIWSMVADAADHIELQSGRRVVGLATASVAFAHKFGIGLGAGLAGMILAYTGYQPNAVASETARQGIVLMIGLLPALLYTVRALMYFLYPLDRARLGRMQADLQTQRDTTATAAATAPAAAAA